MLVVVSTRGPRHGRRDVGGFEHQRARRATGVAGVPLPGSVLFRTRQRRSEEASRRHPRTGSPAWCSFSPTSTRRILAWCSSPAAFGARC